MKKLTLFFCLITFFTICRGQGKYSFSIMQYWQPNGPLVEYKCRYSKLKVFIDSHKEVKLKLNKKQKYTLDSLINKAEIAKLDSEYSGGINDGTNWVFKFKGKKVRKIVYLDNYYIKSFDVLLIYIKTLLPNIECCIEFDEDMRIIPDTTIKYLPDFYENEIELPDSYD